MSGAIPNTIIVWLKKCTFYVVFNKHVLIIAFNNPKKLYSSVLYLLIELNIFQLNLKWNSDFNVLRYEYFTHNLKMD